MKRGLDLGLGAVFGLDLGLGALLGLDFGLGTVLGIDSDKILPTFHNQWLTLYFTQGAGIIESSLGFRSIENR